MTIDMTLRHLQIFCAVYQEGSVTRAAEKLFIAQPAVSKYIQEIEDEFKRKLFERYSRRMVVTPFGEEFNSYASRIVSLYNEMNFALEAFDQHEKRIRVGSGTAIGGLFLPHVINSFCAQYPIVKVSAIIGNIEMIYTHLLNNTLDFAIMEWMPESPFIVHSMLHSEPIVAICNKKNPLASREKLEAEDFIHESFLLREQGCSTRQAVDAFFSAHNLTITPLWECSSVTALINAVAQNIGISFLTRTQVLAINNPNIVILNVPELVANRYVNVYYHKDKRLSASMQDFINHYCNFASQFNLQKL